MKLAFAVEKVEKHNVNERVTATASRSFYESITFITKSGTYKIGDLIELEVR